MALNQSQRQRLTTHSLVASHQPTTGIEKTVDSLLKASGMDSDRKIKKKEESELMKMKTIDPEELRRRRKELQKMRALMTYVTSFSHHSHSHSHPLSLSHTLTHTQRYEEQKNKRIKKIKSKLYRKIKKKKKKRDEEKAQKLLWETNPELAREKQEAEERKRIKLRMTQKHRQTSAWMKKTLKRGGGATKGSKQAVLEQLQEREKLHRAIMNRPGSSSNQDDEEDEDEDEDKNMSDVDRVKSLLTEIQSDSSTMKQKEKGLFGMKFMQNSMEKQRLAALEKAKALLQDVEGSTKTKVTTNPDGKKRFGGKNISKVSSSSSSLTKKEKEQVENLILESQTQASKTTTHRNQFDIPEIAVATDSNNPWLTSSQSSKAKSRTRTKAHEGRRNDVITVEDDVVDVTSVTNELKEKSSDEKKDQEQKSLIQQAFVGAGVNEESFLKEKEKLIDRQLDDETVVEPQMAGWGSWTGEGVTLSKKAKSRKRRKERRAEMEKQDKRRKIASRRKDAGKKTVIISEKRDKKAAQFTVKQVPYPFKSRAQYEASLRRAIGGELNTSLVVDRETRPEVYTRAGVIITPARLPRRKFRT